MSCAPRTLEILPEGRIACGQFAISPRPQPITVPSAGPSPKATPTAGRESRGLGSTTTWMTFSAQSPLKVLPPPQTPAWVGFLGCWLRYFTVDLRHWIRFAYQRPTVSQHPYQLRFQLVVTRRPAKGGFHPVPIHPTSPGQTFLFSTVRSSDLPPLVSVAAFPGKDMNRDGRQATRQFESHLRRPSPPRWASPTEEGRPS